MKKKQGKKREKKEKWKRKKFKKRKKIGDWEMKKEKKINMEKKRK